MASELVLVIDDRNAPPSEIEAVLGKVRFLQIMRRRRRLSDELAAAAAELPDRRISIETVTSEDDARALVHRIETKGPGPLYLRLPSCIMPLQMSRLPALLDKARYAFESMLVSPLFDDEAVTLLTAGDAAAVLRATSPEERRDKLLRLAVEAPAMIDHLDMVDLRKPRAILKFLSGSTEARHFNALRSEGGVLYKTSSDIAKMRTEHDFFHVAPGELKRFLICTFGFWERDGKAGYAMEHMAIPDAALQFVHGAFDEESYGILLDQIFAFLKSRTPGPDAGDPRAAWESQITRKMHDRLDGFLEMEIGRRVDGLLVAADVGGGLAAMRDHADAILARAAKRDTSRSLVFSHGDPCFSNILFDRRLGMMRLIDPRGASAPSDAMMHPLYDVAKVSHSALGGYDFVNNSLFSCSVGATLGLELQLGETGAGAFTPIPEGPPDWAKAAFRARLASEGYNDFVVRAVELSLFLSMLPLHADHPPKLLGFALIAANLIKQLEMSK